MRARIIGRNKLSELGHTVKLIAPQFVKPYVKRNKNDARDAEAICEAVSRPNMRFVPIKTVEQQATLALHRGRQGFVWARTAQSNQLRGLLSEFGIVMPKGISNLERRMPEILEDAENGLPNASRELFARLYSHFKELDRQADELERQIKVCHLENPASQRLEAIPGIGPLSASALAASISDAKAFRNGRQLARVPYVAHVESPQRELVNTAGATLVTLECTHGGLVAMTFRSRPNLYIRPSLTRSGRTTLPIVISPDRPSEVPAGV